MLPLTRTHTPCCCCSVTALLHQPTPWSSMKMLIPSAHPLPSVLRAKKIDAKFSSNEKQAFSAATVIFRGWWWWWKVKINQPNHPNTHPPLADQQQQHHMKLLSQLRCLRRPQRRLQLRRRVDRSSDQSTHQHQNETCAPACLSVSVCV